MTTHHATPEAQKQALIATLEALVGLVGFLNDYPHPLAVDISGYIKEAEEAIDLAAPLTR